MTVFIHQPAGVILRFVLRAVLLFPVPPVLYLIEPFYRVRPGALYTQRLRHMALNMVTFLRKISELLPVYRIRPSNRQLMDMWQSLKKPGVKCIDSRFRSGYALKYRDHGGRRH